VEGPDEADPAGKTAEPQPDQAHPADQADSPAVEDPAREETKDAARQVQERDQNPAEAGLLGEEDEAQHLGLAEEEATSEGPQAPAWEQDQSTGHPAVQGEPISKLGMESEMPAEVSELDQQVHRNLGRPASGRRGSALETPIPSPDGAR